MIELHRLGAGPAPFRLNPDLIVTVEATPDTTISLTTGTKVLVAEGVEAVVGAVRGWPRNATGPRRDGLLALEEELENIDDEFLKKGLQLVVDGTDPDLVREILEAEIEGMTARHRHGAEPFDKAGGFAPTMGIIGTVMGLVHVLQNLSLPETLGPAISSAFIATLMGVGSANVIYYPIAYRLKALSKVEADARAMILEGILAIQAGDNPRIVTEKLLSFVPPEARDEAREAATGPNLRAVPDEPMAA